MHSTQVIMSVGQENILDGLGRLALEEEMLKGSNITRDDLAKVFPKVSYGDLEYLLLGLLERHPQYKVETYCFKERYAITWTYKLDFLRLTKPALGLGYG